MKQGLATLPEMASLLSSGSPLASSTPVAEAIDLSHCAWLQNLVHTDVMLEDLNSGAFQISDYWTGDGQPVKSLQIPAVAAHV